MSKRGQRIGYVTVSEVRLVGRKHAVIDLWRPVVRLSQLITHERCGGGGGEGERGSQYVTVIDCLLETADSQLCGWRGGGNLLHISK